MEPLVLCVCQRCRAARSAYAAGPTGTTGFPGGQRMGHPRQSGWCRAASLRTCSLPSQTGMSALARSLGPYTQRRRSLWFRSSAGLLAQNGNAGTDHGHGNVMWLMGGPVMGGKVHGEWPDSMTPRCTNVGIWRSSQITEPCWRRSASATSDFRMQDLSDVFPEMPNQSKPGELIKT